MVYCSECGTKNDESAAFCVKCGKKLNVSPAKSFENRIEEGAEELGKRAEEWGEHFGKRAEEWGESFEKRAEKECFGLPHGGTIFGLIIGIIIILVGTSMLAGIDLKIWPLTVLIFGVLIFGGAIYSLTRKQ